MRISWPQDLGRVRLVSLAIACDAATGDASPGGLLESPRQLADLRETWLGENDAVVSSGRSTGEAGAIGLLLDLPDVGAAVVASQTGPATGAIDQEAPQVRGLDHRRLGLCAAESRGDGGLVHAAVGTVRARQCAAEFEPALFQMGADLQGPHDDGCGDRSADPSLGDHRTQHSQLPTRGSQEEPTQISWFKGAVENLEAAFQRSR